MDDLRDFFSALASHWLLLGLAVFSMVYAQFGRFDPDKKTVPALILFAICCFLFALYLTITHPLSVMTQPR